MKKAYKRPAILFTFFLIGALWSYFPAAWGAPALPQPYKVAILQIENKLEKESNVSRLLSLAEEAGKNGAKLMASSELSTTGYMYYGQEEIRPLAEPIPGPTTDKFAAIAKKYGAYIAFGMIEIEGANYYNSVVLIGKDGSIVGKARKTHAYLQDTYWATDGDLGMPVFATEIGNIGLIVCRDGMFFEPVRIPALKGADMVIVPFATGGLPPAYGGPAGKIPGWPALGLFAIQARSFENHIYVVAPNHLGLQKGSMGMSEFPGFSVITGPDGEIVASAGRTEQILYGSVDIGKTRNKKLNKSNDKFADRRPTTYAKIQVRVFPPQMDSRFDVPKAMEVTTASIQMEPKFGDKPANLAKIESLIDEAQAKANSAGKKLQLVVLPEMATTGCIFNDKKEAQSMAEPIPGPTLERIAAKAVQHGLHIVFGMPESSGTLVFNTAVLIGPDGKVVGKYRKAHLWETDMKWATPGDIEYPVFRTGIGRIGLLVGYDLLFPEPARVEAIERADIIAAPVNSDGTGNFVWNIRARENQVYLVVANRYGTERGTTFNGTSAIHDFALFRTSSYPWNDPPMKQAGPAGDDILIDVLNTASPRDKWGSGYIYGQRKPELYGTIVSLHPEQHLITREVNVPYEQLQEKYLQLRTDMNKLHEKYEALISELPKSGVSKEKRAKTK